MMYSETHLLAVLAVSVQLEAPKKELDNRGIYVLGLTGWFMLWRDGRAVDGAGLENQ